jgi:hypothetical protein
VLTKGAAPTIRAPTTLKYARFWNSPCKTASPGILALAMCAGKTILMGSIVATEFAMAMEYPDGPFVQPTSMPFQFFSATSLRPAAQRRLSVGVGQRQQALQHRGHHHFAGARGVAVVHLDGHAQAQFGQGGAVHAFGADLAEHAFAQSAASRACRSGRCRPP